MSPGVLLIEAGLLVLAAISSVAGYETITTMVLAMGIQNAAVHHVGQVKTSLTYVTGTLVSLGEKITDAFRSSTAEAVGAGLLI